jgi:hypothetical protein
MDKSGSMLGSEKEERKSQEKSRDCLCEPTQWSELKMTGHLLAKDQENNLNVIFPANFISRIQGGLYCNESSACHQLQKIIAHLPAKDK